MIPEYDFIPSEPIPVASLITITGQEWDDGSFDSNLEYTPIHWGYDWGTAEEALSFESRVIAAAGSSAQTADEFEEALLVASEDWEESLDLGAAGLVLAMTAAGFRTSNSCRGHAATDPKRSFGLPFVRAVTNADLLGFLIPRATEAGCTVAPANGQIELYGRTVSNLVMLGHVMLRDRAVASTLPAVEVPGDIRD